MVPVFIIKGTCTIFQVIPGLPGMSENPVTQRGECFFLIQKSAEEERVD